MHLIYYYYLMSSLLFMSYTQNIYSCCYLSYNYQHHYNIIRIIIHFISIIIPQTCGCHRIIVTIFSQIIHQHRNIKIFCIVNNKCVIDYWYEWPKWSIIKGWLFISNVIIISSVCNMYSSFYNNIPIPMIT